MLTNKNNSLSEQNCSPLLTKRNLFSGFGKPLILLAENDKKHRHELKSIMDLYAIKVLEAKNGEETVHLTVCESPDLVLINSDLPNLDGFEAVRLIRNIRQFDKMPIIMYSENTERVVRKKAFELGADSFHIAPLDFERIDYILENFLFRGVNKNYLNSIFKEL
jgi:DNA-binding response OmpR family regulator